MFPRTNRLKMYDDIKHKRITTTSSALLRYHYNGKLNARDLRGCHSSSSARTLDRRRRPTPQFLNHLRRAALFVGVSAAVRESSPINLGSGRIIVDPSLVLGRRGGREQTGTPINQDQDPWRWQGGGGGMNESSCQGQSATSILRLQRNSSTSPEEEKRALRVFGGVLISHVLRGRNGARVRGPD